MYRCNPDVHAELYDWSSQWLKPQKHSMAWIRFTIRDFSRVSDA